MSSVVRDHARGRRWHRCPGCDRPLPENVRRCSTRTCPAFAETWARDTRRRLLDNLKLVRLSVMFSVTAPGSELYPFDLALCTHPENVRCSGKIGCRVNPAMAHAFNTRAGKWWSELHRRAKIRADRATGHRGRILARVWEKQARGLAHLHGVIAVGTPDERAWAEAYLAALRELAPAHGFGFVDGWEKISRKFWPGDQAGAYLSGYFVNGRGRKASLTENVAAGDLPKLVVYVGRHLTTQSGVTMRTLRHARKLWAYREGRLPQLGLDALDAAIAASVLDRRPLLPQGP